MSTRQSRWLSGGVIIHYSLLIIILFLSACQPKTVNRKELLNYITEPENGVSQERLWGDYKITVTCRPGDLFVEQEKKIHPEADTDSIREQYNKNMYFMVGLSRADKPLVESFAGDNERFVEVINELSYYLPSRCRLIACQDTLSATGGSSPRMFGTTPTSNVLLSFANTIDKCNEIKVIIDGQKLGFGKQAFLFNKKDMNRIPKLNIN